MAADAHTYDYVHYSTEGYDYNILLPSSFNLDAIEVQLDLKNSRLDPEKRGLSECDFLGLARLPRLSIGDGGLNIDGWRGRRAKGCNFGAPYLLSQQLRRGGVYGDGKMHPLLSMKFTIASGDANAKGLAWASAYRHLAFA